MTRYGSAHEARNDLADAKRRGEAFDEWFDAYEAALAVQSPHPADQFSGPNPYLSWRASEQRQMRDWWSTIDSTGSAFAIYVADKLRRGWTVEQVAASIGNGIDPEALAVQIKRWGAQGKVAA